MFKCAHNNICGCFLHGCSIGYIFPMNFVPLHITTFFTSVKLGNEIFQDTVELLIKNKADLSARDKHWQTPLHVAAANNAVECVEVMLPQLLNISITDRGGRTSLHHAAYNGHHEVGLLGNL